MGDLVGNRLACSIDGYCLLVDAMKPLDEDKFIKHFMMLMKNEFLFSIKQYMFQYDAIIFQIHTRDKVIDIRIDTWEWFRFAKYGEQVFAIVKYAEFKAEERMALDLSM